MAEIRKARPLQIKMKVDTREMTRAMIDLKRRIKEAIALAAKLKSTIKGL